jgi:tRNA A-37 threonylcarbamoyl transferase component Bud32
MATSHSDALSVEDEEIPFVIDYGLGSVGSVSPEDAVAIAIALHALVSFESTEESASPWRLRSRIAAVSSRI